MSYMQHHAIIVTGYDERIEEVHAIANGIFDWVSPISPNVINGYRSFFVPPDGSKEGWAGSQEGDYRRDKFILQLDEKYWLQWVEIRYGGDEGNTKVLRNSDADTYY